MITRSMEIATTTLKPCPDEEGIKTPALGAGVGADRALKPCPDEEGIKTSKRRRAGECSDL